MCRLILCLLLATSALAAQDLSIRPFRIQVSDEVLEDLQSRLERARFPQQIPGSGWDYGTDSTYMRELVEYWRQDYDWRSQEAALNEFPHFKTEIDGLDLHFIHVRSPVPDAMPLVMTHGWPGSFYEFLDLVGPLTDPAAHGGSPKDAFHLVLPSIPGYGFSDKPSEPGFHQKRVAEMIAELMRRLEYRRYAAQGGDWGSVVTRWLGIVDPDHVVGIHLNMLGGGPPAGMEDPESGIPEGELERWRERTAWWQDENAYFQIQATKPLSLGYGLNDSPVGLAAWIVEKFRAWSDSGGDVESRYTKDQLLTNVMIYWVTESMPSSMRIYFEYMKLEPLPRVEVPTAVAVFPHDIVFTTRKWAEAGFNIQHWTEMPRGGHFAAMEEPELLIDDVRSFFRGLRD